MRILYCNKYNFVFSGTEAYLFEVMDLVRSHGHEAALFSMADPRGQPTPYDRHFVSPVDFKNPPRCAFAQVKLAAHSLYSLESRHQLRSMIADFRPDVAHVRNIYHHLSPSILWELKAQGIPVLYHLNDFKLLCPSYNLVSHGQACERCCGGEFRHVITERCYPGARGSAFVLALEAYVHKWLGTYRECVDCFLAPSQFVKQKLTEHGWDAGRIEVLPHFQRLATSQPIHADAPVLYFGRLSAEKGVADLLRAMQTLPNVRLQIAGDGDQKLELQARAAQLGLNNVQFLGHLGRVDLEKAIAASRFTVFPSRAYETFGKSILESFAHGRAVIASDLGSRRELVRHGKTGLLFPVGDTDYLAEAICFLSKNPHWSQEMGAAGREFVRLRHSPAEHYSALDNLYKRLYAQRNGLRATTSLPKRSSGRTVESRNPKKPGRAVAVERPRSPKRSLSVAFIGGRGVLSKYSGIESYFEEVGPRLVELGYEVTVYCRTYFTPRLETYKGMRLVRLPTVRSKHWETPIHTFLSTVHALFHGYDIVHYHALGPALFSGLPRLLGNKTAVTVQGLDWRRKKWGTIASFILRIGERAAVWFPNATIVVSKTLQQHFRQRHGAEVLYVPNGTIIRARRTPDPILAHGLQADNYVLYLGRFSPEKNCHLLMQSFQTIDTPVKLVLAGGSSHTDAYARELRAQVSGKVILLDWVAGDELDELLTNAMLFVLPSDLEGLSLALLDAMGAGVCTLVSGIPENRELVGAAGFTFQAGDAGDLERKLRWLISSPSIRHAAATRAQAKIVDQYLWPQIAGQMDSIYRELAANPLRAAKTANLFRFFKSRYLRSLTR
jgi:glycosyltransferase involved in cell wall biosynthesis